jgi:hypothetical protein
MNAIKLSRALLAAAGLAMLTGCGGGESDTTATRDAGTRSPSLATAAQADQLETGLGGDVITTRVDSGADRPGAVALAVLLPATWTTARPCWCVVTTRPWWRQWRSACRNWATRMSSR